MQVLKSYDKSGNVDTDKLTDNFIENVHGSKIRDDSGNATDISDDNRITSLPVTVVVDGYDFTIWGSGEVTGEGEEKPAQDKLNITNLDLTATEDSIKAKVQTSNGNGATYTYYYKMSSSSDWIEAHTGSETSYTITGLSANTKYDVKVDATNGDENSSKTGSITTQDNRDTIPPTVQVKQGTITENSISVSVSANDSGSGMPSPATYKYYIKKSAEPSYPSTPEATDSNSSHTFSGLDNNTSYDIKVEVADRAGNTGAEELTGITTLITIPDANVDGVINVSEPQWSNGTASVTVTKGNNVDDSLDIEYKKEGDSNYTKINDGGTINGLVNGDKIYVHLTDGTRAGADKEVTIEDKIAPTVKVTQGATSTNGITVNVNATDNESGMPNPATYKYYIKESTAPSYPSTPTATSNNASNTFSELKQNISYDIKVEVTDNAGNVGTGTITLTTDTIPAPGDGKIGSIVWGNVQWEPTRGTASVTVSKGTGVDESLRIQYQVVENSSSQPVEGSYQTIDNGGAITNLQSGNVVYARLWDGKNAGSPATLNVQDTTPPKATIQLSATTADVGETITATVIQTDEESGVASGKYVFNTTSGNIGTEESSYTDGEVGDKLSLSASAEGKYYLHILIIDRAGNKTETISEAVTIETPGISPDDMAKNPTDYFGDTVNYTPKNNANVKWKIFYVGTNPNDSSDKTNRIYLIADDYINAKYAPNGKGGTPIYSDDTYEFSCMTVLDDYYANEVTNKLVQLWLKWLINPYNYGESSQAVAYLLDTNVWSTFTDNSGKAEYAIGGATLDMFCASYNKKYPNRTIQYESETWGYNSKWSTDSSYPFIDEGLGGLPTNDSLYVINNYNKAEGMWIASPSAANSNCLLTVTYDGSIVGNNDVHSAGSRPIVCLKPDVKLVQQSDGTYNIN